MNLNKYTDWLSKQKARLELLKEKKDRLTNSLAVSEQILKDLREADEVMNAVSVLAQEDSKQVVEELVTLALQSVYGPEYGFEVENKINRGQPETFLYYTKSGERYWLKNLDDYSGGGVIDICSFALRVVCWAISDEKSDNILVLDEPMKNLDNDRCTLAGEMIKELAESLDLQFIIITRLYPLKDAGNKIFFVKQVDEISTVAENK